jgi:predicted DNA-binding transcriptional regulator AlpA
MPAEHLQVRSEPAASPPALAPSLLVDAEEAARLCNASRSHWDRLVAAGSAPEAIRLGPKLVRWLRTELVAWTESRCPDRATWEQLKVQNSNGRR